MGDEDKWDGVDRRSPERWHLEKTINAGHVLTTVTIIASLFVWGSKMDTRVAVLEQQRVEQQRTNDQHDQADREIRLAIKEGIAEVSAKLDRLIWEKRGPAK